MQPPLMKSKSSITPEMVLAKSKSLQENKYTLKDPALQKKLSQPPLLKKKSSITPEMVLEKSKSLSSGKYTQQYFEEEEARKAMKRQKKADMEPKKWENPLERSQQK